MSRDGNRPGEPELLVVGRVIRPHGLRGAFIVDVASDEPDRFRKDARLLVEREEGRFQEITLESAMPYKGRLVAKALGVDHVDEAEGLRGCDILIPADRAARLREGEYWVHELVGMRIVDEEGFDLGCVTSVACSPMQDLLVVRDSLDREFRVPFVAMFVKEVDPGASTIKVRLIEGMGPGS